jgi:hypothetical protein
MFQNEIVGAAEGFKPREILVRLDYLDQVEKTEN